jgi:dTDP-4-dehydrorhamnose reductase
VKVVIVGAAGQLGRALVATAPRDVTLVPLDRRGLDIRDEPAMFALMSAERPNFIINAAAYTAVDNAERDEENAREVNAVAVGSLAAAARAGGGRFVHISTDFVFDGLTGSPYLPDAPTHPLNAYGRTKLEGETRAGSDALIVRTGWLYGSIGGNFVRTMLSLMATRPEVRVVADQVGTPTYASAFASALWTMVQAGVTGIYHYSDAGVASWYDFAVAIQEEALELNLLQVKVPLWPIATEDFPVPARRPSYSVLDKRSTYALLGRSVPHWRENLRIMLNEIKVHG